MFGVSGIVIISVATNYVSVSVTTFLLFGVRVAVSIFNISKFILSVVLGGHAWTCLKGGACDGSHRCSRYGSRYSLNGVGRGNNIEISLVRNRFKSGKSRLFRHSGKGFEGIRGRYHRCGYRYRSGHMCCGGNEGVSISGGSEIGSEVVGVVAPVMVWSGCVKGIWVTFCVGISQKAQSDQLLKEKKKKSFTFLMNLSFLAFF